MTNKAVGRISRAIWFLVATVFLLLVGALQGCSIFANTTPKSTARFTNFGAIESTERDASGNVVESREKIAPLQELSIGDRWTDKEVTFEQVEEFHPPTAQGHQIVKSRTMRFQNKGDVTNAAGVATARGQYSLEAMLAGFQLGGLIATQGFGHLNIAQEQQTERTRIERDNELLRLELQNEQLRAEIKALRGERNGETTEATAPSEAPADSPNVVP